MFALTFAGDVVVFVAGGALVWFMKDKLIAVYKSTEDQIGALEDKIRALKAKL
jgi:hypothetical protein